MTLEMGLVFLVLFITIILFALEVFPVDKIAFFIIVSLTLLGLVKPEEAVSGFSNSATIAVLALMILAIAMEENGVITWLTSGLGKIKVLPLFAIAPIFMIVTASISAFISTTAVVIVFIKIINQLSDRFNISKSKLLLPISFAGILGGSCTLMGTSTNLIVNSVAQNLGAPALSFFEFTTIGLIFLAVAIVYLTIMLKWLPWGGKKELGNDYSVTDYITSVRIKSGSQLVNKRLEETFLYNNPEISILKLIRDNRIHNSPGKYITLKENDQLLLMCNILNLTKLNDSQNLGLNEQIYWMGADHQSTGEDKVPKLEERVFVELLMLPGAALLGKTLGNLRGYMQQDIVPVAIKKRKTLTNIKERLVRSSSDKLVLKAGDRLLVDVSRQNIRSLEAIENIVLLQEFDSLKTHSRFGRILSLAVLGLVVVLAATGVLSIMVSALAGVSVLLLTNNLNLDSVYKKVNWQIFFLLAGMIPLGIAMHNTGADMWISEKLLGLLVGQSKIIIIGSLFFVTMVMSGVVSNNATAIIMTPIAMALASGLNMDFKPFVLAVMFAANFSFFTPVGYQTNTLIYGIGNYKFKHFFIIGGILSLVLWILATFLLVRMA
ncbi:SLC13 family permease [Arenibacter sp. S6351L]|uniref:SLC13 family permease n=1 Tax=Arenibacter sp. S6351L TaxID=2926407 RepID=UPI001FF35AB5|nr:SLC13 family permease [Arenibacter sp. S6351L]MCK0136233.1 SLC13 family permease [Arenibacter sp. S6351L]